MTKIGAFSYENRIIYSLCGFFLLHLTFSCESLFDLIGASSLWSLIYTIISAPGYLFPGKGYTKAFLTMLFWGSAGYFLGYILDRLHVTKTKTLTRCVKNKTIKNPYTDKILKYPENNSKNKAHKLKDYVWEIFGVLCVLILFTPVLLELWCSAFGCPERSRSSCYKLESDAQNTLASLASYFSESETNEVPTLQDLMRTEDLELYDGSTVNIDGPKDEIRVTVIEKKNRCVRGNKYEVYMGGTAGAWDWE